MLLIDKIFGYQNLETLLAGASLPEISVLTWTLKRVSAFYAQIYL